MKILLPIFAFLLLTKRTFSQVSIIPEPVSIQMSQGSFPINKQTILVARDEEDKNIATLFNEYLQEVYGFTLQISNDAKQASISFSTLKFIKVPEHEEGYSLHVLKEGITINGNSYAGTFYGMQTLIQLLPVNDYKLQTTTNKLNIPLLSIQDYPRFKYRGMHLDVGRHFFPLSFIKKYIDYIAYHKMNYFHWHLTDDQGWRIEIKKYPKLTEIGAYRNGTIIGRYPGTGNDNTRYGGYYSQEEIRKVIQYAKDRYITIIPEIEMPGHSSAAIAAYPWLSCFPEKRTKIPKHPSVSSLMTQRSQPKISPPDTSDWNVKLVQETWGIHDDVYCAGSDSTFKFIEAVLDEVINLFPSQYIHVGGDESPRNNWKKCPKCQARIQTEGLKNEHELQAYFIQRIEKYINSKGRVLVGWDEILEGGLAPNAVVMSWRGEKGGIEAAKQNHLVIMTPQKQVYFDASQARNEDSLVIGGYNPLESVYAYEPLPKELIGEKEKFVLGGQGNVWTEYMASPEKVEYMIFPRMSALSEVLWSPKEKRSWIDFEKKLPQQFKRYELWKANYSKAYYDLSWQIKNSTDNKNLNLALKPRKKTSIKLIDPQKKTSYFTSDSLTYALNTTGVYTAQQVVKKPTSKNQKDVFIGNPVKVNLFLNKAAGKKVSITATPNEKYPGQVGAFSLVNGIYSNKGLSYPDWLGWIGDDMIATIDLGKKEIFSFLKMHTINQNESWVYLPEYVEVLTSNDGKDYKSIAKSTEFVSDTLTMGWINVSFPKQSSRYIKVVAKNYGPIPENQPGAGNKAWLFADEIQVY